MCEQKASASGIARLERMPTGAPLRESTMRWMNCARSRCERNSTASGMWFSRRSRTERVASANDRYVAEEAAAAAVIAST
jgi:hypothetical protein